MSSVDLKRLKSEMETGLVHARRTPTKFAIHGEYHDGSGERVQFLRKRKGIEIKWSGSVTINSEETKECDLGHKHQVQVKKHFVWNYARLSRADVLALVDFLSEGA